MDKQYTFEDYRAIVAALRSEEGCPWDRAQTHESLKPYMINEMAEAVAAVNILSETGDSENLCEELGDLLLLILLQSQMAREEGLFSVEDVIQKAAEKMIRRHPHVFPDENGKKGVPDWDAIKEREHAGESPQRLAYGKEAEKKAAEEMCMHLGMKYSLNFGKFLDK
ncbi:MAG: MazG nucleotide pyrophosphohydrolase domain-containing protein [Candidatus Limivivens sp.]|nr:MazG nucleotide pyrophosphohydrolase domain-containing protein [Candidatus Limivivens sp.]